MVKSFVDCFFYENFNFLSLSSTNEKKKAIHVKTLFVDLVHYVKMYDFFFFRI